MERHAQECPAAREDEAHALVGGAGDRESPILGALLERGEDVTSVGLDVVRARDLDTDLALLGGVAQILDEVAEGFALRVCLCRSDEELYCEVGAVVEVVVLTERAVPRGLDGERGDLACRVAADALVDDVLVAAHVAQVF